MSKNRCLLLACLLAASTLTAWTENGGPISIIQPSTVFVSDATIGSPITISGRSELPAGTALKITVSAKVSSFAGGRFTMLNTYHTVTAPNGRWQYVLKPAQDMPFLTETYKIEISAEAKPASCYFISFVSPIASKQRQQEIHSLYQNVTDIWNLDKELKDFIGSIEDIKLRKTGWERKIQEAIGLYSSPEEALSLAIKKWREWEPDYTRRMEILSDSLQERPSLANFISVQERLSYLSGCLYEKYAQYRSELLGSPRKISHYHTAPGLLNPTDNKNNVLAIMEEEIVSKIFQDILSLTEYIDSNCLNETLDKPHWQKIRNESSRICTTLKNELEYYYRMGLFYRMPAKHFVKESQDLTDMIDTLSSLIDKINIPDEKTRNSEEIQTLVTNLHNKITALSTGIY